VRVLVTRPGHDADETASRLIALGHAPLVSPLLEIEYLVGGAVGLDGVQAVLATSSNGIRALARRSTRRDIAVYAVGSQTATEAEAAGYNSVHNAHGDVVALADAVRRSVDRKKGRLFHVAGAEADGRLVDELSRAGYAVEKLELYRAKAKMALPSDVATALGRGEIDAVLHFSARSARIFCDLVAQAELERACTGLVMVCISQSAAAPLKALQFLELRIAREPNQEALLACLDITLRHHPAGGSRSG